MSVIQQRLSNIIEIHAASQRNPGFNGGWCRQCQCPWTGEHVAEVISAELGLTEESEGTFDFGDRVRWVTAWET